MNQRQQNSTSYPILFYMVLSSDHVTPATGKTVTVTRSKNGGSFNGASGAVSEVGNGWYALAGHASDRDTLGDLALRATATGCDETPAKYTIVPWDPFDYFGGAALLASVNDATPGAGDFVGSNALAATANLYSDAKAQVVFLTGTLKGLSNRVTAYAADRTLTFGTAWPAAPADGDKFLVVGRIE